MILWPIIPHNLDRPRIDHLRIAFDHIHAEAGVTLDTVMRFDRFDRTHDAGDSVLEGNLGFMRFQAIFVSMAHLLGHFRTLDQRFAGHASGVEAIAAHLVRFNQRHLGLDGRCDESGDKPCRACADHHHIAIKRFGLVETCIDFAALQPANDQLCNPRRNTEQDEGADDAG